MQSVTPNPDSSGDVVKTENVPFSGTLHAGQISIVVIGFLGVTATWTGSLSGDTLTLNIPQTNGTIAPATLARGDVSVFNSAVSELRNQVSQNRAKVAADAAAAADAQATASANAAAASALTEADGKVSNAILSLQQNITDGLAFDAFSTDMATLKRDLETTRSDAAKATAEGRSNLSACSDAGGAQADAGGVDADEGAIAADASAAQATIDSLSQKSQDLRDAQAAMEAAYQQQSLTPSASRAPILDALRQADTAIKAWKAKVADYATTARELATQATQIADTAAKAVC